MAEEKTGATTEDTFALEIEGVSHRFGQRLVLDDVSFAVPKASVVALLGLNGAGKTTLFSLITRLYASRSGRILIAGNDIEAVPSLCLSHLGVVFQARTLDLDLKVRHNLRYHAALFGMKPREIEARIDCELDRVGMNERSDDLVRMLSGGQARRVEIARALLHEPLLLLLDEPTIGLDPVSRTLIREHIQALRFERGLGALWATHLIDEAECADRVVVLHQGRVAAYGTVEEVMALAGCGSLGAAFEALTQR